MFGQTRKSSYDIEMVPSKLFATLFERQEEERKKFEDTHARQTIYLRNDLMERLEMECRHRRRGFKTAFINHVVEQGLRELGEQRNETHNNGG